MDITIIITGILTFFVSILFIKGVYVSLDSVGKQEFGRRLDTISGKAVTEDKSIIRIRALSYVPWLNKFLSSVQRFQNIDEIIKKAGLSRPLGFFVLLSFFLGSLGFLGVWFMAKNLILGFLGAGFLGISPLLYILYKKNKRMQLFQKQLPDALDLLSQSLRAGHSFPSGIKMVGDEFPDPIGGEFKAVSAEIYYGLSLPDAMKNLTKRVDSEDLEFFVTAAIIQRETGGNLAEMMNNIAHIIRERFKLFAKVKALAAEGILSAWIVSLAPFVAGVGLYLINPKNILVLFNDPVGKKMVIGAFIWLCLGVLVIRKIVRIKI